MSLEEGSRTGWAFGSDGHIDLSGKLRIQHPGARSCPCKDPLPGSRSTSSSCLQVANASLGVNVKGQSPPVPPPWNQKPGHTLYLYNLSGSGNKCTKGSAPV